MTLVERLRAFAEVPQPETGTRRPFGAAFLVQTRVVMALMLRGALSDRKSVV